MRQEQIRTILGSKVLCFLMFPAILLGQYLDVDNFQSFIDSTEFYRAQARTSKDSLFLAQYHYTEGVLAEFYFTTDSVSIKHLRKSEALYDQLGDLEMVNKIRYEIADLYMKNELYEEALGILDGVMDYYKSIDSDGIMAHGYSAIANVHFKSGDSKKEQEALLAAMELAQDSFLLGILHYQFARRKLLSGDYQEALHSTAMALPIIENTNWRLESGILLLTAKSHLFLGNLKKALDWNKQAITVAINRDQLEALSEAFCFRSIIFEEKKEYESALLFKKKCQETKDSLFEIEKANHMNSLAVLIDQETASLKLKEVSDRASVRAQKLRSRNILVAVLTLSLLSFLILTWFLRKSILKRIAATQKLNLKQDELYRENLERLKLEGKHQEALALISGQENERKRMGQDLHDGIGGVLSSVRLNLDHIASMKDLENNIAMTKAVNGVKTAIDEIRTISRNAMPDTIIRDGLETSLRNHIKNLGRSHTMEIDFQVFGDKMNFSEEVSLPLYRVLQELIHNSMKHSSASRLEILFVKEDEHCKITVYDNGIGFDYENLPTKSGLANVVQRIVFINGEIEFDTNTSAGCYVFISIPLNGTGPVY